MKHSEYVAVQSIALSFTVMASSSGKYEFHFELTTIDVC